MADEAASVTLDGIFTDDDQVLFLMDEISRAARKAFDDHAQPLGLNRTQWRVLAQLIKDPTLNQTDIAKRLDLESATIGLAVGALTEQGYVERRRDPADGRAWRLALTMRVEEILPALRSAADAIHHDLWAGISAQQKRSLLEMLDKISANMRRHSDKSS